MHLRPIRNRILDGQPRIERRIAVLEDHLHIAAQLAQRQSTRLVYALAVEDQLAGVARDQMHQEASERRLSATGLADHAKRLALKDDQRYVIHCAHAADAPIEQAAANWKVLLEAGDRQHRLHLAASIARIAGRHGVELRAGSGRADVCCHAGSPSPHQIRTSIAWRSPSLTRLNDSDVMKIAAPGSAQT